jgi:hypothetical protein
LLAVGAGPRPRPGGLHDGFPGTGHWPLRPRGRVDADLETVSSIREGTHHGLPPEKPENTALPTATAVSALPKHRAGGDYQGGEVPSNAVSCWVSRA